MHHSQNVSTPSIRGRIETQWTDGRSDSTTYNPAMTIEVYTDGGCFGNPGPGGWAYIMRVRDKEIARSGFEPSTTNNRMELQAVIRVLEDIGGSGYGDNPEVEISTDSQYVQRGISEWIDGWIRKGWVTSAKKPVKNQDLWKKLKSLTDSVGVRWRWVKGHAGNDFNERCDTMVKAAIESRRGV